MVVKIIRLSENGKGSRSGGRSLGRNEIPRGSEGVQRNTVKNKAAGSGQVHTKVDSMEWPKTIFIARFGQWNLGVDVEEEGDGNELDMGGFIEDSGYCRFPTKYRPCRR